MRDQVIGPETRALFTTRRWLDTMLALLLTVVALTRAAPLWTDLNAVEHLSVVACVGMVCAGAIFGSNPALLWLCPAGLMALPAAALFAPHGSPAWIPMPNAASYAAYIGITLMSRQFGLVVAILGAVLIKVVWISQPTNIVGNSMALFDGWLVTGQVLATALATWWAWDSLSHQANVFDSDFRDRERRADESLKDQERARVWRSTVTRVHESLLNTTRYVLESANLDRHRLALELAPQAAEHDLPRATGLGSAELLLSQVLADPIAAQILRLPDERHNFALTPEVLSAIRNALVEVAHNSVRHGSATDLRTTFNVAANGTLTINAIDNGTGLSRSATPGIGSTHVINQALDAVGGSMELSSAPSGGVNATIRVPVTSAPETHTPRQRPSSDIAFDQGRYLFSFPLAVGATWGIIYFLTLGSIRPLDRTGGAHFWLTIMCGVFGSITALVLASRRRPVPLLAGLVLTMIPALVPWFLRTSEYGCANVPNVAAAMNVAGFAMIVIAVWTGYLPGAAAVITWVTGAFVTMRQVPMECQSTIKLAIANSALILPLAVLITFIGVRTYHRAADRMNQARKREVIEASRAAAASELNIELSDAVNQATELLEAIAAGHPLDERSRHRLEAADARIRAAVQVNPTTAGGLARSVKRIVDRAATLEIPVSVRAIAGSSDPRPMPARVEELLTSAICTTTSIRPTIQLFNDGRSDFISVMVDGDGLESAGLDRNHELSVEGMTIQVFEEDEEGATGPGSYSLLISRPASDGI